ncbi:MAG: urea ABC transporter [Gammaproteobacteria bacterium]|nr:urea ABC transporter [Gammaproteobacteria bacterium]
MSFSRRHFLGSMSSVALGSMLPFSDSFAQGAPIKVGSVLDNSGNLDIYGKPMVMATSMAIDEINAAGGLLGRKLQAVQYDTQSDIALYTKFAQQLVRQDKVDVVHGGITSASREAIRQTFTRANTLYFYNVLYEGGVCDRNTVVTGTTPAQAVEPIMDVAMKQWGKKVYILAADYNYGQITAKWIAHYAKERGGSVAKTDFFALDVSDFGSTIAKIQQEKPSFVISALVGGAHMSFYRQWAASGMNKKIPLASTTFGVGNEHLALSAAEGDGILIAGNYSQESADPANKDFLARWNKRFGDTKIVHEIAVSQYQGIMLWAECVRKAGSLKREDMLKAIESGVSIVGPGGTVAIDPKTHHAALDIKVMEVKGQKLTVKSTVKQRPPLDTARYCDLLKNPKENKQFEVNI